MKRYIYASIITLSVFCGQAFAQKAIKVQAPEVVAVDEQFNITFIIDDKSSPKDFSWTCPDEFQLVWGPQKGTSSSVRIENGKKTSSHQTTFTYILLAKSKGTFSLPSASATVDGEKAASSPFQIQVVTDGASSPSSGSSGGGSGSSEGKSQSKGSSDISGDDIFLRLSLSRTDVVVGEPLTATLKLYQRVNISGFENAKFPTFTGFWSQETYSPTNIEFKRESLDDKIYDAAVLRSYVLIPQQAGTLTIDPAELVCLVNVRASNTPSSNPLDIFFQDEYRTIRKRVTTSAVKVRVSPLPAGQPGSFGGGVGNFGISARVTSDKIKTHDAASVVVTVSGKGNVSLLEAPKVIFPPDFEVYDTKVTENTDKSSGRTSGSKAFEYPFIPRSHGIFEIPSIEYSYYDVSAGKYVTLHTEPLKMEVEKGNASESSSQVSSVTAPGVERRDVKSLADDIRFISTQKPSLSAKGGFFVCSPVFLVLLALLLLGSAAIFVISRKMAAQKADVALSRNKRATRMALGRLKQARSYLDKNLYTAFYEELHKALIGYISDKLGMDMSEISKENIAASLLEKGVSGEQVQSFTDLLDACEFARYSPDAAHEAMSSHYESAVGVISSIDSSLKNAKTGHGTTAALVIFLLLCPAFQSLAAPSSHADSLWTAAVEAYTSGRFEDAASSWEAILEEGLESAPLYCNIADAYFRQGNYPAAILNYERALKIDPSYSDARYNLSVAGNFIQDRIDPVPEFILKSFARKVCYIAGSNVWAVLFLFLLGGALAGALIFLLSGKTPLRRAAFFTGLVLLVLSLCALSFSLWQKADYSRNDKAIVMATVSSVKSSPSEGMVKDLFVLHEGTKVTILDEVGEWKNISLADGRQGWIPSKDLEVI